MMEMLRAFGQPVQHISQHHATMLQDVALKCCERLAKPQNTQDYGLRLERNKTTTSSTFLWVNRLLENEKE